MPNPQPCPSCHATMEQHALPSVMGGEVVLDLCFSCHGLWFDWQENLKLAPGGVVELFRLLHEHRGDARQPLARTSTFGKQHGLPALHARVGAGL